jgi:hypothetical protein
MVGEFKKLVIKMNPLRFVSPNPNTDTPMDLMSRSPTSAAACPLLTVMLGRVSVDGRSSLSPLLAAAAHPRPL